MLTTRPPKVPEASMLTTRPPKLLKIVVLVYQSIKLHTSADTVFINLIFRILFEYFNVKSLSADVADERILYLAEMPETEGPVTCELLGDATANALNLKVF
jgi:hypothetical protein